MQDRYQYSMLYNDKVWQEPDFNSLSWGNLDRLPHERLFFFITEAEDPWH